MRASGLSLAALVLVVSGCRDTPPAPEAAETRSPNAQPDIVAALREDLVAPRHPSDGGGRAWLEAGPDDTVAGGPGTWTLIYEAGPHGVAVGGMLLLQVSPFWGWSTPQVDAEDAPGYTSVSSDADGVALDAETLGPQLLGIRVGGRALDRGRAGPRRSTGPVLPDARADTYAERESRFWVAVDGDGDGVRGLVADSPVVEVGPVRRRGWCSRCRASSRPGETVRLNLGVPRRRRQRVARGGGRRHADRHGCRRPAATLGSPRTPRTAAASRSTSRPPPRARCASRRRGPAACRGRQSPRRVRDPAPGLLGRPSRSLGPLGRDGNARGLLPLRPRRRGARRRRAHRPRPLGHAAALGDARSCGRGSATRCRRSTSPGGSSPSSATSGRAGSTAIATCSTSRTRAGS